MILYFQKRNQKADVKKNYELGTVMKPHILVKAGEMLIQPCPIANAPLQGAGDTCRRSPVRTILQTRLTSSILCLPPLSEHWPKPTLGMAGNQYEQETALKKKFSYSECKTAVQKENPMEEETRLRRQLTLQLTERQFSVDKSINQILCAVTGKLPSYRRPPME
ncbi:hypothetical protein TURU_105131 [Turdus rufiventris]|nr:hypothetical protein TURU_105131 [Turdus rufiventris]